MVDPERSIAEHRSRDGDPQVFKEEECAKVHSFFHENTFTLFWQNSIFHGTLRAGLRYITCVACVAFGRRVEMAKSRVPGGHITPEMAKARKLAGESRPDIEKSLAELAADYAGPSPSSEEKFLKNARRVQRTFNKLLKMLNTYPAK